jgi:hemoglobin
MHSSNPQGETVATPLSSPRKAPATAPRLTGAMSIYDSIGGRDAVGAAVDDFYERVLGDPSLVTYFADTDVRHLKAHQRAFITMALGGPDEYRGKSMAEAHAGLEITADAFHAVVAHLAATLAGLGVDEATIGQIASSLAPLESEIVTSRVA